jgi:hypothetical protein
MFHPHGDSAHPDSLIVRTKGKVAHDFIKRMNGSRSGFTVEPREIDFERLRPLVASMKGAWFKDMKAANVTSTGLFGPRVDKSSEFKHAENIGTLNAVLTNYPFEEIAYTIMITGSGGLVLYDNFETDETALPVVDDIRINFLEDSWAEATDKRRGKKIKGTD